MYNNLDMPMHEVVRRRSCFVEGVIKCYPYETLEIILDRIVKTEVDIIFKRLRSEIFIMKLKIMNSHPNPRSIGWFWWIGLTW